jgi:hypothetical protein
MTAKEAKKFFAVARFTDLGLHIINDPLRPKAQMPAYVSEFEMRRKTTGKRTVRFRVYSDEWLLKNMKLPAEYDNNQVPRIIREVIDQAAVQAVRQVLDQL